MTLTIALLGALIGAIPGALGVLVPWLRSRESSVRLGREIALGRSRVEFLEAWLQAHAAAGPAEGADDARAEVRDLLGSILSSLQPSLDPKVGQDIALARGSESRVRVRRALFLGFLGFTLFGLGGSFLDDGGNFSGLDNFDADLVLGFLFFAVVVLVLFVRWRTAVRTLRVTQANSQPA